MTIEQLRNTYLAEPFRPFTINMADGRALRVSHRELLSHSPSGRTVIVYHGEDGFTIVDLLLVASIEVDPQPTQGRSGNGDR